MNIQIRRAEERDVDALTRNVVEMAYESSREALETDQVRQGIVYLLSKPEFGFYMVAEKDGDVIGSLLISYEWSDWRGGFHWWIGSVYVLPEERGQGVYSRLYEAVKALAEDTPNAYDLKLWAEADNGKARASYEKLGMRAADLVTYYSR